MSNLPDDLFFTAHDEWIRSAEGDTLVSIGITHFAQDALGEIVHVELPEVGSSLSAGDPAGEIESVKAVAEIYAPVTGEIVEVNDALDDEPELLNASPYDSWIFKMKIDPADLTGLMDAAAYQTKLDEA